MLNIKIKILFLTILLFFSSLSYSQALLNNGGQINALQGSFIYVNGSVFNQSGGEMFIQADAIDNAELYITGDITNDATITDNGHIRLLGNWYDNGIFNGGTGTVFLEGGSQILGGTSETVFNNLTLDGSDAKTQTIDKYCSGILDLKHIELKTETNVFFVLSTNIDAIIRTSGFVSSLNGGKLSRNTNQVNTYLYPVGSSLGVARYRPVEITPASTSASTYAVRLANLDANLEGFNRSETEMEICRTNELFYHQIARTSGSSVADISISFDNAADGDWEGIANWKIPSTEWQVVDGSYVSAGAPFDEAIKTSWNDFNSEPYILYNANISVSFDPLGPFCIGSVAPSLPSTSNEGIVGTWSPSVINTSVIGFVDYVFTPNFTQGCYLPYTMTIEIENCCSMTASATVTAPLCNGDNGVINTTQVGGVNPISYTYNGIVGSASYSAPAGNYEIIATDVFGCTASTSASITQPALLQVYISSVAAQCGGDGGSAFASVVGGVPNYDFLWLPGGQTLNNITSQAPGNYTVIVTDNNDCSVSSSVNIGLNGNISSTITQTQLISCPQENDGILEVTSTNGVSPVTYEWNNGIPGPVLSNLSAGSYTVTFSDSWGCVGSATSLLIDPEAIIISETIEHVSCYGLSDGAINIIASGGSPPHNYLWNNTANSSFIDMLEAGTYSLTIIDSHSCTNSETYIVNQPNPLIFENQVNNITCFGYNDGAIALNATGGTNPYIYSISQGGEAVNGTSFYGLSSGYYDLIVTDANDCSTSNSVVISEPAPITALYTYSNPSCIGNADGHISVEVTGGTSPYLFGWQDYYIDIPFISGLVEGSYDVLIIDANNCEYELNSVVLTDIDEDCIRIPNAFTPNGDGPNDTWIIENIELFSGAYMSVYNRWGQELWVGRPGDEWDGQYNGKFVPAGTYLYIINLYNGSDSYTGTVTVVY